MALPGLERDGVVLHEAGSPLVSVAFGDPAAALAAALEAAALPG
jgi:hypothetical protein